MQTLHLITTSGLELLLGDEGNDLREEIMKKDDLLDYQFFDDDRKSWELWAVKDSGGDIKPLKFLAPDKYGMTSAELFSKTVTYPTILAQVIEKIRRKAPSGWDKFMKPATVVSAIVLIILILVIGVVALQG